jgi:hypothetical protein
VNWPAILISAAGVLLALISLTRTFMASRQDQSEHIQTMLATIQERCSLLEMKMGVFWRMCEEHLSTLLKKPTHIEMDDLLDKLRLHTLNLEESKRLRWWLQKVYLEDEATHAQARITAILVIAAVESLIHELERKVRECSS